MSFWAFSYFRQISDFRFSRKIFASLVRFIYVYSRSDDYVEWVDVRTRLLIPHSRLIWSIHRWIKTETNIFSDKTNIFWSIFLFYCIFAGNPEFRPSGNPPPPDTIAIPHLRCGGFVERRYPERALSERGAWLMSLCGIASIWCRYSLRLSRACFLVRVSPRAPGRGQDL